MLFGECLQLIFAARKKYKSFSKNQSSRVAGPDEQKADPDRPFFENQRGYESEGFRYKNFFNKFILIFPNIKTIY